MSALEDKVKQASVKSFLLVGVLLGAVYYFNYYDGGAKYQGAIDGKKSELQGLQKELNDIESLTANFEKYQEDLNDLSKKFQMAVAYIPSQENVYVIVKQLYIVAKSAGVNVTLVKPDSNYVKKDFYEEMPISIEAEGGYLQLLSFLSNVVNLSRIINLQDVSITSSQTVSANPVLKLKGRMLAYRYLGAAKK